MDKNDKKILKYIVQLILLGGLFKLGFDIKGYLSIKETLESTVDILLLVVMLIILFILFCVVVIAILKLLNKKKDINNTKEKINRLERKMRSTRKHDKDLR